MSSSSENERLHFPFITFVIAGFTLGFFLLANWGFIDAQRLALIPAQFHDWVESYGVIIASILTLPNMFTAALVHSGWAHIIGNLVFFIALAPALEKKLGAQAFCALYVVGAIVSSIGALIYSPLTYTNPLGQETIVSIAGASGAIAAVMGGVLVVCPKNVLGYIWYPRAALADLRGAYEIRDWKSFFGAISFPRAVLYSWVAVVAFVVEQFSVINSEYGNVISSGSAILHLVGLGSGVVFALSYRHVITAYKWCSPHVSGAYKALMSRWGN